MIIIDKNKLTFCMIITLCSLWFPLLVNASAWNPADELKSYLLENYPWEEVEVSGVRVTGKIQSERPEMITVEKGPIGRSVFSFIFNDSQKVTVKANVRAFERVVKSRRPLGKGHVLRNGDLYLSKMDIRKMPKSSVRNIDLILGKPLKRSVSANRAVVEKMVEKARVIRRGSKVMLLVSMKGFNITSVGKTKEKGYVGMPVNVINLSSKKEVRGVLIDENTVKVEL